MKTHEFAVRFGAAVAATPFLRAPLGKQLKSTRSIELSHFTVDSPGGSSATWMIKLGNGVNTPSTNSWSQSGYAFPVGTASNTVVFDRPRLLSFHAVPTLGSLDITITDFDGGPVSFTSLTLWLLVRYDDDHTDLAVVASEAGWGEPVQGKNNWRSFSVARQKQ